MELSSKFIVQSSLFFVAALRCLLKNFFLKFSCNKKRYLLTMLPLVTLPASYKRAVFTIDHCPFTSILNDQLTYSYTYNLYICVTQ